MSGFLRLDPNKHCRKSGVALRRGDGSRDVVCNWLESQPNLTAEDCSSGQYPLHDRRARERGGVNWTGRSGLLNEGGRRIESSG